MEERLMSLQRTRVSKAWLSVLVLLVLPVLAGCERAGAGKYSGTWKRELSNEGEVAMKLSSGGDLQLMLPSPRWPDSVDVNVKGDFHGDTLVLKADTTALKCQTGEARYLLNREGNDLHVAGLGMDSCGGRRPV